MNAVEDRVIGGGLRVSDADRDRAVTELTWHFEAGRITQAEFEERSAQALAAKTEADLAGPFADLPRQGNLPTHGDPRSHGGLPGDGMPGPTAREADEVPVGPAHVGLPRPMRFAVAPAAIAVVAILALVRLGIGGGPQNLRIMFVIIPILIVLAVIRRLARYR